MNEKRSKSCTWTLVVRVFVLYRLETEVNGVVFYLKEVFHELVQIMNTDF